MVLWRLKCDLPPKFGWKSEILKFTHSSKHVRHHHNQLFFGVSFSGKFFSRSCFFSMLWVLTNFLYIRGLYALGCSEMISLFATNVSFVYMLSWVVLHEQFVGIRVSMSWLPSRCSNSFPLQTANTHFLFQTSSS